MRSVLAFTVLFVAHAAAKIGFGACPQINNVATLAQYQAAFPCSALADAYNHKVVYGDKGLEDLLGLVKNFAAQVPSFKCNELFPVGALCYKDATVWNPFFNQPSDSIVIHNLGFNAATKSEAMYYCIDTARGPALLHALEKAGVPIPPEAMDAISMINNIRNTLNFLKIEFRFEGIMVTTNAYASWAAAQETWVDTMIAKIPEYARADLVDYKTGC